jgi:hypothetical protein
MNGALPPSLIAEAVLIMAWKCLVCLAPAIVVGVLLMLAYRTDQIIHRLFPDLEWEKSLGWLNIRAERRANTALRWLGYAVYGVLVGALYGIAWAAVGLQGLADVADPLSATDLALRLPVLLVALGAWVLYFGSWLIPKIRAEREEAGLKRFRAQMEEVEREQDQRERNPRSRVKTPLRKPRTNGPLELPKAQGALGANRGRNWRQPGG